MQGMEAAVKPARRVQASKSGSRTASTMQVTPAVARNGPELPDSGPLPGPTFCLQGDRTPSLVAPKPPRTWKLQLQGPSVLESKVKALKEKMTARKQGANPCPTSYERPSPPKSKCCQVKPEAVWSLLEGSPLPDTLVVPHAQNQTDGQLDISVNEKKPARNGGSRPSTPGLGSCNGQSLWSPEAVWLLADHGDGPAPGSGSLQESPNNQVSVGQPEGPGPCKTTHLSSLKKRRPYLLGDGVVTEGDLDNRTLTTSKEDLVPRTDLPEMFRRAGGLGALGTGTNVLSLSEQVERNRLLLQEMLKVSRQGSSSVGSPDRTPSWDRAASERPAGDVDWDSGTPLQDSGQSRICVPKLEPVLSARDEGTKHLTQHARMKARTQPLRASHDIVPTIAQGSRNGQSSPALDVRSTSASRESLQNGNLSDSSSVESGNGQWPRQGMPPSHVRFEDESAHEAESRYLERRQQRQRQVLCTVLPAVGQGPLRSKPDLTNYINHNMGNGAFRRPVGSLDHSDLLAPPSTWNSERPCSACGSYLEERCPAEGRAAPDLRVLQGLQATCEQALLLGPCNSHDLSSPFPGLHAEWIRETHITDTVGTRPEEGDSALNSAINSDSRTDIKDARTSQPSGAGGQIQGSSPRQWQCDSRPQEGPRWPRTEVELPWDLQAWPHIHEEPRGAAVPKSRVDREYCCQEPGLPLESDRDGTLQDSPQSADVATVNSTAVTLSLTSEEPGCHLEPHRTESSSGGHMPTGASPEASAGHAPPSTTHSDGSKKRRSSISSTLGLKKLFSALGHIPRASLGTSRSYSVEQLQPSALAPQTSTSKMKRAPSLQILHLVSPSHQHRKAASFQNLHSLLGGKGDRSSFYRVEGSGDPSTPSRPAKAFPHRALSVEDVGAPSLARTVGRVVEVFPDGTSQLQLQRPPEGTFGFHVAYGNGRRDSGLYVQAMANRETAKLYSGLLGVGDEILEVNGAKVAGLGLAHIKELLAHVESLSIRVLRQRPVPQ
ncbi:uncharacterized protein KIAA1614 homolog isoform X2 [Microtus ochrogaster]|uniref:Uncharacterized protein KIAA1614 homolog isoform X2 n=1 Tax=Microtus ochrogaster TaxID=79684 RepID=A0ABM1UN64_MICOH|nr:uncharacterized protein KIAA1614 homolog isoform X2 [Microtus ochrogaster]